MTFLDQVKSYEQIKQEWFEQWFNKSGSFNSKKGAGSAMATYEDFLEVKHPSMEKGKIIEELKIISNHPDKFSQLYGFINDFVQYQVSIKKSPATIRIYTMFIKSFLRQFGIRINNDDMKQFVHFPKLVKELRQPMTLDTIKLLLSKTGRKYRSMILISVSSGSRFAEILQSKVSDYTEIPIGDKTVIQFRLRAGTTKTREERLTYISHEAWKEMQPLLVGKKPSDYVFIKEWNQNTVIKAEDAFNQLRKRCGLLEKYGNGFNYHVNFHSFRAFFLTKATQKVGENIAHAWIGHHKYLDQYFRLTVEERAAKYLEVEPDVTINEETRLKLKLKDKDETIRKLEQNELIIQKLIDKVNRLEQARRNDTLQKSNLK